MGRMSAKTLSGWGLNHRSQCDLVEPDSPDELAAAIDLSGTLARGLGRSYGDAALNTGKRVLGLRRLDRFLSFDAKTGTLRCEAGVCLDQIIRHFAPLGWFPLITPGTKFVTVGGCIANDVHGKAHHAQGCFSSSVRSLRVLLADGRVLQASREENADLFWAQFGGLGLLGVIVDATITLRAVSTTYFRQKAVACESLESLMDAIDAHDAEYPYSVGTLDTTAMGQHLGRGVLTVGDHASVDELPSGTEPLHVVGAPPVSVPFELPTWALNSVTSKVVNAVIAQVLRHGRPIAHSESFFYPLDAIAHWNRAYGAAGFTQYQFVIPVSGARKRMRELLQLIVHSGNLPFLNVLKRLGPQNEAPLSFPFEGYTLAIDFPVQRGTAELMARLDERVIDAGGRVYLGKDSYLSAKSLKAMYPRLGEWLAVKAKYDPRGVFQSDLGRRVGLVP